MPLTLYRRPGSNVWHYRGTLAGHRLRGSTGASNKENAQRAAAKVEDAFWKRGHAEKQEGLTWPKAVALYMSALESHRAFCRLVQVLGRCEDCGYECWFYPAGCGRPVSQRQEQHAQPSGDRPDAGSDQSLRRAAAMPTA
jgi:hypothetical protein